MRSGATVGLGALWLDPGVSGGSETYLREMVPRLVRAHPEVRFELATTRRGARTLQRDGWAELLPVLMLPCDDDAPVRRTLIEAAGIAHLASARGWDLVHTLSNRGPAVGRTPSVVTVMDTIFFEHPTLGTISSLGMRAAVRAAAAHARKVITISRASADDIVRILGTPRERIVAIPLGAGSEVPVAAATAPGLRSRLGLAHDARIVLSVGAKRPHKNQELLLRALPDLPADVVAVLPGHDEGYGARLRDVTSELGLERRVRLLDRVPATELEALWSAAECACLPTRAEGFGLPVLEAMRRGVPVACSDIPSLREVAGGAAELFGPDDPVALAAAVLRALSDDGRLADRGRRRVAEFSWDRTAEETFAVYEDVLG